MPFCEKATLRDERKPLLRDPVWHNNYRYGQGRRYGEDELDELLGLDSARHQRFRWILFLTVTFLSILVLLATMGVLIKLAQTHPSNKWASPNDTTNQFPFKVSQSTSPYSSSTTPASVVESSSIPSSTKEVDSVTSANVNSSSSQ